MQSCTSADHHILLAIQLIRHCSVADFIIELVMPQDFPRRRIERNKVPGWITGKKQSAGSGKNSPQVWLSLSRINMLPANLAGLIIHRDQNRLTPQFSIASAVALRTRASVGQVIDRVRRSRTEIKKT